VEYDQETTSASTTQPPTTTATPTMVQPTGAVDACQDVATVKEHQTYSIQILTPELLADKQARCEKIKKQLARMTKKSKEGFWALTFDQSCEINEDAVTLHARLNEMSLTFVSLQYFTSCITI